MKSMRNANRQQGFTLLEVMVVLAIIGGIMALVATNIIGSAGDARIKTTKSQIKLIENALDLYKLDNFTYPTTEQGLEALVKKPSSSPEPKNYKSGGYLKGNNVPTDSWGNEFMYFLDKGQYEIVSLGADGQEGGEEENADISSLDH
ncbi:MULTISPECIES: type II secretion system major pseudopilin GspG [Oceanospirillaceae]|jgi:general secretion pathway protein G|uniref:type II secretion system major pseudopilin GspG n=2 Tax=Oceanospirillales TaxID=135619 RepID=UPI001CE2E225|nr:MULTISPECIES: type II secretion system major pseudopilin GspG [Thalassolituus]MCB2387838.1 type II secretion system major pseudopilin GspG [Thalassolituus alkanivorans]MCB2422364.1 type II secretion system major pseudopilin GspG [Thalassolituus alkanivorans]